MLASLDGVRAKSGLLGVTLVQAQLVKFMAEEIGMTEKQVMEHMHDDLIELADITESDAT